jgi:hypothetical protein
MKRQDLINRLVARKLNLSDRRNIFCVCLSRALCFAGATQPRPAKPKN